MSDYNIGRDFQELRSRVERLERYWEQQGGLLGAAKAGVAAHRLSGGVDQQKEPILWKAEKHSHLPPFMNSLLGLPAGLKFDLAPESKTWHCYPEPLILSINWDAGGSAEFYRLQDQLFSVIRVTDPNSGITTATANYTATLVASGKAKSHEVTAPGPYPGSGVSLGLSTSRFDFRLLDAVGGALNLYDGSLYSISCNDRYPFNQSWNFNPGLYDLVAGANWQITGIQSVDRC